MWTYRKQSEQSLFSIVPGLFTDEPLIEILPKCRQQGWNLFHYTAELVEPPTNRVY